MWKDEKFTLTKKNISWNQRFFIIISAPANVAPASETKKITKIYNGLTSCVSDQHVHVECKEEVVAHLIEMAEPELVRFRNWFHGKLREISLVMYSENF